MEVKDTVKLTFYEIWKDDEAFLSYVCANFKAPSLFLGIDEDHIKRLDYDGPAAPYEVTTGWSRKRIETVEKRERELFEYFSVHGTCGDKKSRGYFARKEHRTAAVSRLFQIDDARKKEACQADKKKNVEKRIAELEAFCREMGRLPNSKSSDEHEKRLAYFKGNIRNYKNATPEQKNRAVGIISRYKRCKSPSERLAGLISFVDEYGHWPRQGSEDAAERNLAHWLRKSNLETLSKEEYEKYDELESLYKPGCNKYLKLEPDVMIEELRRFIKSCGHYPRGRKPKQHEQGALYSWDDERKLAEAIKTYMEEGRFNSDQVNFVEERQVTLKPSGSTSYSEKLLLCALKEVLKDTNTLVRSNVKLGGVEVDAVLEMGNSRIGIQYDGGAHNRPDRAADDVQKTGKLIGCSDLSKIIRIREDCLPELGLECERKLEVIKIERPFSELSSTERERVMSRVLVACEVGLRASSIPWDKIEPIAHRVSSTGVQIAHLIGDAVVHLLIEGDDAGQSDDFVRIVKRLRKYKDSESLLEKHVAVLRAAKKGFASNLRCGSSIF